MKSAALGLFVVSPTNKNLSQGTKLGESAYHSDKEKILILEEKYEEKMVISISFDDVF